MYCKTCKYWTNNICELDDPIDGSAACFRYDHYTPIVDLKDELKPIFDKEKELIEEIESRKYTYEEATSKCKELYAMVPAEYMVEFYSLYKAMDATYPGVLDHSFKQKYIIPVGNIPTHEIEKYIQDIKRKIEYIPKCTNIGF
jgi:hypothetical protein